MIDLATEKLVAIGKKLTNSVACDNVLDHDVKESSTQME